MAIVEEVPDDPSPSSSSNIRSRRTKASEPASGADIPLVHPSTVSSKGFTTPLIDPTTYADEDEEEYDSNEDGSFPSPTPSEIDEAMRNGTLPNPMRMMRGQEEETERDGWDVVFDTALYVIPFTSLFVMLDILVYMQYSFKPPPAEILAHTVRALPTISLIIWYTNSYPQHWATNSALMSASLGAGARLIWLMNKGSWGVVTAQAPAMGTLWTLTIVQLPLSRAVVCLILVGGWVRYSGLSLQPT